MNYAVCIKQVPETSDVEIDPVRGTLKREGVDSKMNPFDLHALEAAVEWRARTGGTVTVVSMGPPQAAAVIKEAFSLGADHGILLSDRRFAGADTLATGYTLSRALLRLKPDIVICGMQTIDGDTAQVGPAIAEFLGLPQAAYVRRILSVQEGALSVETDMGYALYRLELPLPCLLTVTRDVNRPRLPSYRQRLATRDRAVTIWSADDLGAGTDFGALGLDGSPTQVERIFSPEPNRAHEVWTGSGRDLANRMYHTLKELKQL
ncbi:MAG: electron transfer flavoprotein subunit beta/FixA family protein [Chloroflexota bacterium]